MPNFEFPDLSVKTVLKFLNIILDKIWGTHFFY